MPWQADDLDTLTVPLASQVTESLSWDATVIAFPSGHETRVSLQEQPRRRLRIDMNGLTQSEYAALLAFFTDQQGMLKPFKFTWDGASGYYRFASGVIQGNKISPNHYNLTIEIIEVHPSEVIE